MTGTDVPPIFRASSNFSNLRGYVRFVVGGSNFSNFSVQFFSQFLPNFAEYGAGLPLYNLLIFHIKK